MQKITTKKDCCKRKDGVFLEDKDCLSSNESYRVNKGDIILNGFVMFEGMFSFVEEIRGDLILGEVVGNGNYFKNLRKITGSLVIQSHEGEQTFENLKEIQGDLIVYKNKKPVLNCINNFPSLEKVAGLVKAEVGKINAPLLEKNQEK